MFGIENLPVFIGTGILLNLYPGPDTLYIIGRSVSQGRTAGVYAVLGISTGALVHSIIGAMGLSAILTTSAHAFMVVKYIGAAYLIYQGIKMIFEKQKSNQNSVDIIHQKGLFKVYKQGALTNILNPKVAIFFMALLPQFISVESTNKALSFIMLGLIFITTGTIWCLIVALFSSGLSHRLRKNSSNMKWLMRLNGALFTYLGVKLATSKFGS